MKGRRTQRIEVFGRVQGVGFRPYAHRAATELGLDGWVRNVDGHVELTVSGSPAALRELVARLRGQPPPLAAISRVDVTDLADVTGENSGSGGGVSARAGFTVVASRAARDPTGRRRLRRVPARAVRPGGPALPLPVRQLHRLRPAGHPDRGPALRPRAHHHAPLPALSRLRGRVRGPGRPALPRRAAGLPGARSPARLGRPDR